MTAREQAEELKRQAIDLLLKEREAIDAELKALGYGQENATTPKRRADRRGIGPLCGRSKRYPTVLLRLKRVRPQAILESNV